MTGKAAPAAFPAFALAVLECGGIRICRGKAVWQRLPEAVRSEKGEKMRSFIRGVNKISEVSGSILMWFAWILTLIIMWEVIARTFFNHPTVWAHELSGMVFGALSILGGAYTLRYKGHVNMDLFYINRTPRGKAIMDVITFPFFFVFCLTIIWLGWEFAWRSVQILELSQSDWAPPLWPIKLTIPLGALLLLIQGIANLLNDIMIIKTGEGESY
jgi:TRAP-type mannitol/chloroaromatic compound transport system permease small subunit